ncbi:hypothetical protein Tco_1082970 [Tanacetum coccineum]|uniref:Uncharacterized protein n=1 Tax=Tanacetum coccineum TaxID=301880 RepID=A0ABQ5I3D8_9ASTR
METKNTSSSGSVLEEPEIQKLQMQAKIFKENSLNKLNALKSTTQLLERQSILYQQAFAQLFGDSVRTFKFQLSQHMNNLETLLNAETLHEMDSKSALSVIKVQFERFINSDLLKPLDIYSRSFSSDREVRENFRDYTKMTAQTFKETIIQNMNSIEQCIIERASHEQELKMTLKKLSERQLQIQQCKVQEVQSSVTSSGDETSSGIVSDEEIDKQKLEAHYSYMAKIQEVSPEESSSTSQPLEQVQNHDENDVFANVRRHSEQPESINDTYVLEKDDSNVIPDSSNICTNDNQVDQNAAECVDERAALANLIANLTLDTEENKTVLKQLKKANASLTQETQELKGCAKITLMRIVRASGGVTQQSLPQNRNQGIRNTNVLKPGMFRIAPHKKQTPQLPRASCQDSYITTRVGITIPPSDSNAEDNRFQAVIKRSYEYNCDIMPEHSSDTLCIHNEDGNPSSAIIKQQCGSQDKYVVGILKKFDFATIKTTSTPMESNKALLKDEEADSVDISERQLNWAFGILEIHHLTWKLFLIVNMLKLALTGNPQQEKQTIVANSTTEAEYVVAANCCGQVLWIQNQMLDYGFNFMNTKIYIDNESTIYIVKNLVFHSKTKHIEIRHHFIKDCYKKKLIQLGLLIFDGLF